MRVTGLGFTATRPSLGRLAHIRAVLAVRLALADSEAWRAGQGWWRSERRIRHSAGWQPVRGHVPDAEVSWPDVTGSRYPGECWAIEAELTPKPAARVSGIMAELLARTAGYEPGSPPSREPRYNRVVYLAAGPARPVVERAAAALPARLAGRLVIRDLPLEAML